MPATIRLSRKVLPVFLLPISQGGVTSLPLLVKDVPEIASAFQPPGRSKPVSI
nr:MAG TPA: hypothetical protein [Caudoviricetes sp.]